MSREPAAAAEQERCAALLFARLCDWLRDQGVERSSSATELELARSAAEKLKSQAPLQFVRDYYLPVMYGHGARATLEAAIRWVESLCGPVELPERGRAASPEDAGAGSEGSDTAAPSTDAPAAGEAPSPARARRHCVRCGNDL